MIVISMALVIVGAVTLVMGVFFTEDDLTLVYVSIVSCLLAGLFLIIGVVRGRPSRKPAVASGGERQQATWAGATQAGGPAGAGTLTREEEEEAAAPRQAPAGAPEAADESVWQPSETPARAEATTGPEAAPAPAKKTTKKTAKKATKKSTKKAAKKAAKKTTKKATKTAASAGGQAAPADQEAASPGPSAAERRRMESALEAVSGVGPAKRERIVAQFGSYQELQAASTRDLAAVEGVSSNLAERIRSQLQAEE